MRDSKLGLWMIGASLVAIVAISLFLLRQQSLDGQAQVRRHGVSMVRLLSGMTPAQIQSGARQPGLLQHLLGAGSDAGLAYAALVDRQGRLLADASAPGTVVPAAVIGEDPASWFGEQTLQAAGDGRLIHEFHGPVLDGGHLAGFVRLGFLDPGAMLTSRRLSELAAVALPVFLLVPLAYLLVRREFAPLRELGSRLAAPDASLPGVALELKDFVGRLDRFVGEAQRRIRELEAERGGMLTSQKLLAYKREKVETILQALPDAVLVLDDAGLVTFANRKLQALLGVDPDAIIGQPPQRWCSEPALLARLSGPQAQLRAEVSEFAPAGAPDRRIGIAAFPLFSPQDPGSLLGTLLVMRDATREHLARSAATEFVAHVSHELKSPLNVIAMYAELLMNEGAGDEALRVEAVNAIHDNVERMSGLIGNLLNIAKIETGTLTLERKRVRLHDLLQDVCVGVRQDGRGKDLLFDIRIPPELSPVMLDKDIFAVAVKNLLTNAVKYNRPGGRVTLVAEETPEQILIRVRDTGLGIPAADQPRVFDKFFRSEAKESAERGGHGLGLFLAREVIALHHGSIAVESEPGKGSEFVVALPKTRALVKETL